MIWKQSALFGRLKNPRGGEKMRWSYIGNHRGGDNRARWLLFSSSSPNTSPRVRETANGRQSLLNFLDKVCEVVCLGGSREEFNINNDLFARRVRASAARREVVGLEPGTPDYNQLYPGEAILHLH